MKQQARLGVLCGVSAALLLSGCAAIVDGTSQPVSVETRTAEGHEIAGASCKLENSKGTWYTTTPGTVTIHRSFGDLQVSCSKSGADLGTMTAKSSANGWIFGNLLFGGVIGLGVDIGTGAGFEYPKGVTLAARRDDAALTAGNDLSRKETELPEVRRTVSAGAVTMVAAHADSDRMCKSGGTAPSVQVLQASTHGTVDIRQGEFVAPGVSASDACSSGKIYGTQIYYRPDADFHGTDHVRYAVATATGHFTRVVDIEVR